MSVAKLIIFVIRKKKRLWELPSVIKGSKERELTMEGDKATLFRSFYDDRKGCTALLGVFVCVAIWAFTAGSTPAAVVWAVGDGAGANNNDLLVSSMIEANGLDNLLYLGDVYETGTAAEFTSHYEPSYGRFKSITYPTPGNHEWGNRDTGYFPYWNSRIGGAPYYAVTIGGWRILSLNSENDYGAGGSQVAWLRSELAANPGTCNIALVHRPRFSAGSHGDQTRIDPLWQELKGRATIMLSGHDHNYQRINRGEGTTHFVVGSGGRSLYTFSNFAYTGLRAYDMTNYGALRLELTPGLARHELRTAANAVLDQGTIGCEQPAGSSPDNPGSSPGDQAGLSLSIKPFPKRQLLTYALRRGVRLKVKCRAGCTVTTKLQMTRVSRSKSGKKRKARSKRRRKVTLGRSTWKITSARSRVGRIKFSTRRRAYLKRRSRITVKVVAKAKDEAGNTVKKSTRVVLSKPK